MKKNCVSLFTSALPHSSLLNAITGIDCAAHNVISTSMIVTNDAIIEKSRRHSSAGELSQLNANQTEYKDTSSSDAVTNDASSETAHWLKNASEPSLNQKIFLNKNRESSIKHVLNLLLILTSLSLPSLNAMDDAMDVDPVKNSRKRPFAGAFTAEEVIANDTAEAGEPEVKIAKPYVWQDRILQQFTQEAIHGGSIMAVAQAARNAAQYASDAYQEIKEKIDLLKRHVNVAVQCVNNKAPDAEIFFASDKAFHLAAIIRGRLVSLRKNLADTINTLPDTTDILNLEALTNETLAPLDNLLRQINSFDLSKHDLSEHAGTHVFSAMTNIHSLTLNNCNLPFIPILPPSLAELSANGNPIGTHMKDAPHSSSDAHYLIGGAEMSLINLKACTQLKYLSLRECSLAVVVATNTLERLDLSKNILGLNIAHMWQLCADHDVTLASLIELSLEKCSFTKLPDFSNLLPMLQKLFINHNNFSTTTQGANWQTFARSLSALTTLTLKWCEIVNLPTLQPTLHEIDLCGNNFGTAQPAEWTRFFTSLPNLIKIGLQDCRLRALPIPEQTQPLVEELKLCNSPHIRTATQTDWQRFFAMFPAMTKVYFEGCCIASNDQVALRTALQNITFKF